MAKGNVMTGLIVFLSLIVATFGFLWVCVNLGKIAGFCSLIIRKMATQDQLHKLKREIIEETKREIKK